MRLTYFYYTFKDSHITFLYATRFTNKPKMYKEYQYLKSQMDKDIINGIGWTYDIGDLDFKSSMAIDSSKVELDKMVLDAKCREVMSRDPLTKTQLANPKFNQSHYTLAVIRQAKHELKFKGSRSPIFADFKEGDDVYIKDKEGQMYYGKCKHVRGVYVGATFGTNEIIEHPINEIFKIRI